MSENTPPSAFNPMPPVIVALFAVIAGLELVFSLGTLGLFGGADASSWRFLAIERYGVNTSLFSWMLENKHYPIEHLLRFISFSFLHQSMISTAVSCALLLAIGKMVGSAFLDLLSLPFSSALRRWGQCAMVWQLQRGLGYLAHLRGFMASLELIPL